MVAISVDPPDVAAAFVERLKIPFAVLSDPGAQTAEAWGVAMDTDGDPLAVPAVFVLDTRGVIRFRSVGEHIDDRPGLHRVLRALSAID